MLAFLAALAVQQSPLFEEVHRALPEEQWRTRAVLFADLDGDGDPDLVSGHAAAAPGAELSVLLNRGDGTLGPSGASLPPIPADVADLVAADVDGDGDVDLILAGGLVGAFAVAAPNAVLLNDGTGSFTAASSAVATANEVSAAVAAADLDGNGTVDLVFANDGAAHGLYLGDGSGNFTDASGQLPATDGPARGLALIDDEDDGDLDVFIAEEDGTHRLFLNDGSAQFTDASAQLPTTVGGIEAVAAGDVTGDGLDDLVLTGSLLVGAPGVGFGQSALGGPLAGAFGLSLADLDGDLDLDVVSTQGAFENAGGALVALPGDIGAFDVLAGDVAVADLDADGDLDACLGRDATLGNIFLGSGYTEDVLLFNDGAGQLVDVREQAEPLVPFVNFNGIDVELGDLDGDGDLDAFVANNTDVPLGGFQLKTSLYLNDGWGRFADANDQLPFWILATGQVVLADADGDSDLDAFVRGLSNSDSSGFVGYYVNDGSADFSAVPVVGLNVGGSAIRDFALGDLDGDGDNDIVTAIDPTLEPILFSNRALNDGAGQFGALVELDDLSDASQAVGLGDLDGDGDLDAFFGNSTGLGDYTFLINSPGQDRVWLNAGDGTLSASIGALPVDTTATNELRLVDLDRDGDLDAWTGGEQDDVLLNDGAATFVSSGAGVPAGLRAEFIDFDLDGDLDFLSAASAVSYANDGAGGFAPVDGLLPTGYTGANGVAIGDVDGDGDDDAFIAAAGLNVLVSMFATCCRGEDRLWTNRTRHVGWNRAASIGKTFELELCGESDQATFLWIAPLSAPTPLGIGTLWLDPLAAQPLDSFFIAPGCTTKGYGIPDDQALVGAEFFLQSIQYAPFLGEIWTSNLEPVPVTNL